MELHEFKDGTTVYQRTEHGLVIELQVRGWCKKRLEGGWRTEHGLRTELGQKGFRLERCQGEGTSIMNGTETEDGKRIRGEQNADGNDIYWLNLIFNHLRLIISFF